MSVTANGFANAFSTWIAQGNGLNSGNDGVMRYNAGPMKGMTRDQAQMNFQNEVWRNAAPEWKDEYAKRATTDMLAPSEKIASSSQRGGLPTVSPPMSGLAQMFNDNGGMMGEKKPMMSLETPTVSPPMMNEDMGMGRRKEKAPLGMGSSLRQPGFGQRGGTGASQTGALSRAESSQPSFGNRRGTGASQTGML
jgi:hypothetical protein